MSEVVADKTVGPTAARRLTLLSATCAFISVMAAALTIAAPSWRGENLRALQAWVGWPGAPAEKTAAEAAALRQVAVQDEALRNLSSEIVALRAETTRQIVAAQPGPALAEAVGRLSEQTQRLQSSVDLLAGRVRATALLGLAQRLRRNFDAGLPVDRDAAAIGACGPFPPDIAAAIEMLRPLRDGVSTPRELADAFEAVEARLWASADAGSSWTGRAWSRLRGASDPAADEIAELRTLVAAGRLSRAADLLAKGETATLATGWVQRVRLRSRMSAGLQAISGYALEAYDAAATDPTGISAGAPR